MRLLPRFAIATTACFFVLSILASVGFSQTAAELKANRVLAQELLRNSSTDKSELVLPEDYFINAFKVTRKFPVDATGFAKTLTLRDTLPSLVIAITYFSSEMIEISNDDTLTADGYVTKWKAKQQELLANAHKQQPVGIAPPEVIVMWEEFFDKWQADVMKADAAKFQVALKQAAFSLLRIGFKIEEEWIAKVKSQTNVPAASGTTSTSGSTSTGTHNSHLYHRHEIRMWRITRPRR